MLKPSILVIYTVTSFVMATPVYAAEKFDIDIPSARLDQALSSLSRQTGISIGGIDLGNTQVHTRPVKGHYSINQALQRMLNGSGYGFVIISTRTVRIVRTAPRKTPTRSYRQVLPRDQPPLNSATAPLPEPIIVTASKQSMPLDEYAGSAQILNLGGQIAGTQSKGIDALLQQLPSVSGTNLGPGQNKIFLRGIADSSFNGGSQSTVSQYFGETRLTYSAPNPDLKLYDVEQVDILEGPQGTLYGAGSLGGIIRITPAKPDLNTAGGTIWASGSLTAHGDPGYDIAGMANIPLSDYAAVRVVGYDQHHGGYIDDEQRDLSDVNSANIAGWRAALQLSPGNNWAVELSALAQSTETRDSQFAESGLPRLTRRSFISQPFETKIASYSVTVSKSWPELSLVSNTSLVRHKLDTIFDATSLSLISVPTAYDDNRDIDLVAHESRLSWADGTGVSWVAGIALVNNNERRTQTLQTLQSQTLLSSVGETTREMAMFAEGNYPISSKVRITAGGRAVHVRTLAEVTTAAGDEVDPDRSRLDFLPSTALSWQFRKNMLAYLRYQKGYRPGGIGIDNGAEVQVTPFESDEIDTYEGGIRWGLDRAKKLSGRLGFFYSDWSDIQADRVNAMGFPFTGTIGNGRVSGVTASLEWRPATNMSISASFFANESNLSDPADGLMSSKGRLPNIAEIGTAGNFEYLHPVSESWQIKFASSFRYTGKSQLGSDKFLNIDQGDYLITRSNFEVISKYWSVYVDLYNLFDSNGNSFSLGNPFTVSSGAQRNPVKPRTVTLGVRRSF